MRNDKDIQHQDITTIERTGYAWFPRRVYAEVSEAEAKNFCKETFDAFWEFIITTSPSLAAGFIDDNQEDFMEWRCS